MTTQTGDALQPACLVEPVERGVDEQQRGLRTPALSPLVTVGNRRRRLGTRPAALVLI